MFTVQKSSFLSSARLGELITSHGVLRTPFFMPIATRGVVKTLASEELERLGARIILSNAYHLWLRPGLEALRVMGGLHRLMSWDFAILTDSGGFQVFSLSNMRKLTQDGVHFRSHIDGAPLLLTPERSIEIQRVIGSDICMVLDVCTELPASLERLAEALALTTQWAARSKEFFYASRAAALNPGTHLFGIVQGGTHLALRKESAQTLVAMDFDGYAIGGLSVGEPFFESCNVLDVLDGILPKEKPRYFMGGAQPHEIVAYVRRGVDIFDCVLPTRNARHGLLYRFVHDDLSREDFYETVHVTNEKWKCSSEPLVDLKEPDEIGLSRYTYGYLRHLFSVNEMLGLRLATLVNVKFYLRLMGKIREGVEFGRL